jgi:hypothetical protein
MQTDPPDLVSYSTRSDQINEYQFIYLGRIACDSRIINFQQGQQNCTLLAPSKRRRLHSVPVTAITGMENDHENSINPQFYGIICAHDLRGWPGGPPDPVAMFKA